jgi:putative membrane protein
MKSFLVRWIITAIAVFVAANIVKGIEVPSAGVLLVVALVLGIINAFLRPVILLITLPINILTLGLLTLFINGALFYLVAHIVKGFRIADFWSAFWGAILVSIVSFLLNYLAGPAAAKKGSNVNLKGNRL